jgi:hypothetical protein
MRIGADNFGGEFFSIREHDPYLVGRRNDVVVGSDVAVVGEDHTGAEALFAPLTGNATIALSRSKELAEWFIEWRDAARSSRGENVDHVWRYAFRDRREARGGMSIARHRRILHIELHGRRGGGDFRHEKNR